MSIIQHALTRLSDAVTKLDKAMYLHEADLAGRQQDMFTNSSFNNENKKISEKLNVAIGRVEKILEDA